MILIDFNNYAYIKCYELMKEIDISSANIKKVKPDLFLNIILNGIAHLYQNVQCDNPQIVLCKEGRSWRRDVFADYKRHRTSDDDFNQYIHTIIKQCETFLKFLNIPSIRHPRAEGDDVIASICYHKSSDNERIVIVSNDHDIKQLITKNVSIYNPQRYETFDSNNTSQRDIDDMLETMIFRGDSSDNIPTILKNIEFSDEFKTYLKSKDIQITPLEFSEMSKEEINAFTSDFNVFEKYVAGKNKGKPKDAKLFFKKRILTKAIIDDIKRGFLKDELIERNMKRNAVLTDFRNIPIDIHMEIEETFKNLDFELHNASFKDLKHFNKTLDVQLNDFTICAFIQYASILKSLMEEQNNVEGQSYHRRKFTYGDRH